MSTELCPHCHELLGLRSAHCEACGLSVARASSPRGQASIHPAAPLVFVLAALVIGAAVAMSVSLAAGVPLGLLGGGIGVWMLERGRRLL